MVHDFTLFVVAFIKSFLYLGGILILFCLIQYAYVTALTTILSRLYPPDQEQKDC